MTNPRYRPRDYCLEPELFGKRFELTWREAEERDNAQLAAAQLQHEYACFIRKWTRDNGESLTTYATRAKTKYDRLVKVLRGEAIMRLDDIGMAHFIFNQDIRLGRPDIRAASWPQPKTTNEVLA
jgi:hypothetical protein